MLSKDFSHQISSKKIVPPSGNLHYLPNTSIMVHPLRLTALTLAFAWATLTSAAAAPTLNVVPAVQSWSPAPGTFDVNAAGFTVSATDADALRNVTLAFRQDLAALGLTPPSGAADFTSADNAAYRLTLKTGTNTISPEGYVIEIGDTVTIRGSTPTGVFYGTRTLLQLLAHPGPHPTLPHGVIRDWPQSSHRLLMLDVGRKPYPLPVLKDYLRLMAWYKMNELHLHLSDEAFGDGYSGFRVQCDTFPGLTSKDLFYTKAELRELQDEAKAQGITITPEIDMPGHARCFTTVWPELGNPKLAKSYLDVTNPKTIERLERLLDEMIPIFDAPDFHIGTDEYHLGGLSAEDKLKFGEGFRTFINTMNTYIRSKGKNCRIWSGYEYMPGTTVPDPSVTIDMWVTRDAQGLIAEGHNVINSSDGVTYLCPGCDYYGVDNQGIYNNWAPWKISDDPAKNPAPNDPRLLGGKLHVWGDHGPTGYTMTEIADLTLPSLQAFAEKLWGNQGSPDYRAFQKRTALTLPVPGVTVFDRLPATEPDGVVLDLPGEQTLATAGTTIPLPLAGQPRADLEYPWTLTLQVRPDAAGGNRGVLLSSALAEICADYSRSEVRQSKDAAGKTVKTKVTEHGFGVIRAAGTPGSDAAASHLVADESRVYGPPLTPGEWQTVTVVATREHTVYYLNGVKTGESRKQAICPLAQLGSLTGNSFVGQLKNLKVWNRTLTAKEIGRATGRDVPDNLAAHRPATASASDTPYGFTPEKLTDEDPGTRWSSGITSQPQWVALDLGTEPVSFNTVSIAWETARPKQLRVQTSDDGQTWQDLSVVAVTGAQTTVTFPAARARQLRLQMSHPATQWGYSIWEVEVWNKKQP